MAERTFRLTSSRFSRYVANSSSISSRLPLTSPALVNETNKVEKTPGCRCKASDKDRPLRIFSPTFVSTFFIFGCRSSLARPRMARSNVSPAEYIVANWRVKNTKLVKGILFLKRSIDKFISSINGPIKSQLVSTSSSLTIIWLSADSFFMARSRLSAFISPSLRPPASSLIK